MVVKAFNSIRTIPVCKVDYPPFIGNGYCGGGDYTTRKSAAGIVVTALNLIRGIPTARLIILLMSETEFVAEKNISRESAAGRVGWF